MSRSSRRLLFLRSTPQVRCYSAPVEHSIPLNKQRYVPDSGTYPKGFVVSGVHVGVKPGTSKLDLALVISEKPCVAACVKTSNKVKAAPVELNTKILAQKKGRGVRGVVINSGCANAVTGDRGLQDATAMVEKVDTCLPTLHNATPGPSTLVMSTGVIGQHLPIQKILEGVPKAVSSLDGSHDSWLKAARAICTTDTFPKLMSTTFSLPSSPSVSYSLAGIAKGAGMINPKMATLLGVLCTDAPIHHSMLRDCLKQIVDQSFNAISIDTDTSTNDTVALFANGAAGGEVISRESSDDGQAFLAACLPFAKSLAQLVVRDGEGASKYIEIRVRNAADSRSAKAIATSVAGSSLVKTAMYGQDANWGRILCAIGNAGHYRSDIDPSRISLAFVGRDGSELVCLVNGVPQDMDEVRAKKLLQEEDIQLSIDMGGGRTGNGRGTFEFWTCDFSHGKPPLCSTIWGSIDVW